MRLHTLSALLTLSLLAACNGSDDAATPPAVDRVVTPISKLALKRFDASCGEFLSYAADAYTEQYLAPIYCLAAGFGPCPVAVDAGSPTPATGSGGATPERVSTTNTQEEGVDEADIVKADAAGNLYILGATTLHVLPAFPPAGLQERAVASVTLSGSESGFYAQDFFLDEAARRVVVMGSQYGTRAQGVNVVLDISNPASPVEVSRLTLDGYGLEARRIGNRIHRVQRYDVPLPAWFSDSNDPLVQKRQAYQDAQSRGDQATADRIKAEIRSEIGNRVNAAGPAPLLPRLGLSVAGGNRSETQMACADISHPEVTTGMGLALIDSFSTTGTLRAASGIINNAYTVYGSAQNLYLAQSSFGWFFDRAQSEQTAIYRLQLSETGAAQYRAVGAVDGSIIGRYALSEHAGALRVASTQTRFTDGQASTVNGVTVLNATGAELSRLGAVENLAPGERIQGVRFIGERGYVVTFRQVDPLFALDLSNPAQPRVTDELKIPGFSSYLMPLGSSHLLTIGRAGDEQQLNGQVAVQLFDVANPADIRQVASLSPQAGGGSSYSYSAAEYDPHAFSYFPDRSDAQLPGTLSVPLQSYDRNGNSGFTGFLVLRVDAAAAQPLREIGRIRHDVFLKPGAGCSGGSSGSTPAPCSDAYYAADPRRSVFMQDAAGTYLYTVSTLGVIASDAGAPSTELGRRELPQEAAPSCCVAFPAR